MWDYVSLFLCASDVVGSIQFAYLIKAVDLHLSEGVVITPEVITILILLSMLI